MKLQEIITKFKKKSWPRLCTLHSIDKWDLIDYLSAPWYANRHYIKDGLELTTRSCFKCGTKLNLGIFHGNFLAQTVCNCANDNTNLMTTDKLSCVFTNEQVEAIIKSVNSQKRKGLATTIEFWTSKGYSLDQAEFRVSAEQKLRSARSPSAKKGARGYSIRTTEYWVKKGFTPEDAANKVKEIQVTNGLDFYTKKYGNAGKELFIQRIDKWLNADGNKKMVANRSKKSIELFENLGVGYFGPDEKTIRGKHKVHRVDFLHGNKIIEYYGDYWHGNPKFYSGSQMIRKKKVSDVWEHDAKKIKDLEDNGYTVMIIWEYEFVHDSENTVKKCKDFVK
jgi:G:T-mismatch repair DNA endonuclease (very short patch repair protein)